jgi:ABC-2 type transport system permease protein/lipopolysaccharide transport system permease protein
VTAGTTAAAGVPRYRRDVRLRSALAELWGARELLRSLSEIHLRARYKQTVLGFAWTLITPLALMLVFTVFFQRVGRVDTHGAPYPLYSYLGLLPWTFFSSSVNQGGQSLLLNVPLLNKLYCPREIFPLSAVVVAVIDMLTASIALGVLFVVTGYGPRATSVWLPVLLAVQLAFTVGVTLIVSAVIVYVRDLRHALTIILQLGLFATPVAYGLDAIPASALRVYTMVNPLAPVIDGLRRTVLYGRAPDLSLLAGGAATSAVVLVGGLMLFKRLETGFADAA